MPIRTIASDDRPAIGLPSKAMEPPCGTARPEIVRNVVDLPAPFEPSSVTTWPSSTAKDTPRSASISP